MKLFLKVMLNLNYMHISPTYHFHQFDISKYNIITNFDIDMPWHMRNRLVSLKVIGRDFLIQITNILCNCLIKINKLGNLKFK